MGLLDKLKGHKKDTSVSNNDDTSEKDHHRSPSTSRKSVDRQRAGNAAVVVPAVPTQTSTTTGPGVVGSSEPVAVYPVEGTAAVGRTEQPADNASIAALKDGRAGETDIDGLNRDLQKTTLSSPTSHDGQLSYSYQPFSYDPKNLSQTPFDREAFHKSLGTGVGTTTYESVAKAAVVQETVKHNILEEIHPIFHREHHVIHHQTRIQPVLEQVLLPPKHYVLIDGQKHEITGDAIMNHVVKQRDFIPMAGVTPKVTVHQYVDTEPLVGPVTGVGASLINKDVMLEHQRIINASYENKAAGRAHDIPTGQITTVNYLPGQVPVSTVPGTGPSSLAQSSVERHQTAGSNHSRTASNAHDHSRLPASEAIERSSGRLQEQRASHN